MDDYLIDLYNEQLEANENYDDYAAYLAAEEDELAEEAAARARSAKSDEPPIQEVPPIYADWEVW
jgi:hypothetical protein